MTTPSKEHSKDVLCVETLHGMPKTVGKFFTSVMVKTKSRPQCESDVGKVTAGSSDKFREK